MKANQKRILVSSVLMLAIGLLFWTGSRYPQLNEKALMGSDADSMGISFDTPRTIQFGDPILSQIISHTINWIETNKKGMTFGLFFGAILMVLFSLLKDYKSNNRLINAVIGTLIGAPLGVCVNCAAPIAMGMKDAGAKTETALATMVSSPTLNVIVVSMMFSLLPPYMVWFKIGSTIVLLLLVIPLLSKWFQTKQGTSAPIKERKVPKFFQFPQIDLKVGFIEDKSWFGAIKWTAKGFLIGLWYLIRTAVPLMILAGLLGNILITFLPLEGLVDMVETSSTFNSIILMLAIATIGTFLPVPIAFDVLITAILWGAGLPIKYAMILLFTLGSFSIYSGFVVDRAFSRKLALAMFAVVGLMGMANGTLVHYLERGWKVDYMLDHYAIFKAAEKPLPYVVAARNIVELTTTEIDALIASGNGLKSTVWRNESVEVSVNAFSEKLTDQDNWFTSIEGQELGIDVPYEFSPLHALDVYPNQRSASSGDVHGDGYPDLLMASAHDLFLYANVNGKSFHRQPLKIPDSLKIQNAALVDLDNDGWLDVAFSTHQDGNYVKYNRQGHFAHDHITRLPQTEDMITTMSMAFGDINQDGLLDIVMGNWSLGDRGAVRLSIPSSKNFLLQNDGERGFQLKMMPAPAGETLTMLISNFMGDEAPDMIVGNDFLIPDYFYEGSSKSGELKMIDEPKKLLERLTRTTMSIATVDIDNDLVFEIYEAQVDESNTAMRTLNISTICGGIKNEEQRGYCEVVFKKHKSYINTLSTKSFKHCAEEDLVDCIAFQMMRYKILLGLPGTPEDYFTEDWEEYNFVSDFNLKTSKSGYSYLENAADVVRAGSVLLKKNEQGKYIDQADKYGVTSTGWAWNTRFADLDNDEWQDLFVANGYLLKGTQESNMFYRNEEGRKFTEITDDSGLKQHLPSSSFSYFDYDLDGDLDIFLATTVGPTYLYENKNHKNKSIAFKLTDEIGNRFGIGSKITIYYGEGKHQMRELLTSGGYQSYDEPIVYFGLGEVNQVHKVVVNWSTGEETEIEMTLESGSKYTITRLAADR